VNSFLVIYHTPNLSKDSTCETLFKKWWQNIVNVLNSNLCCQCIEVLKDAFECVSKCSIKISYWSRINFGLTSFWSWSQIQEGWDIQISSNEVKTYSCMYTKGRYLNFERDKIKFILMEDCDCTRYVRIIWPLKSLWDYIVLP